MKIDFIYKNELTKWYQKIGSIIIYRKKILEKMPDGVDSPVIDSTLILDSPHLTAWIHKIIILIQC